jgi:putative membrane protein
MTEEQNTVERRAGLSNTDLAFERTMLSYERTLMAWIRTAMSLISFGFTIYKFFDAMDKPSKHTDTILTPRVVGMIMILFGLLALLLAQVQHQTAIKRLKKDYPTVQKSLSSLISVLVLVFGLALFLGALFRQ